MFVCLRENRHKVSYVLFTEATFTINGVINLQNSHYRSFENPYAQQKEVLLHRFSVNVFYSIINKHMVG